MLRPHNAPLGGAVYHISSTLPGGCSGQLRIMWSETKCPPQVGLWVGVVGKVVRICENVEKKGIGKNDLDIFKEAKRHCPNAESFFPFFLFSIVKAIMGLKWFVWGDIYGSNSLKNGPFVSSLVIRTLHWNGGFLMDLNWFSPHRKPRFAGSLRESPPVGLKRLRTVPAIWQVLLQNDQGIFEDCVIFVLKAVVSFYFLKVGSIDRNTK